MYSSTRCSRSCCNINSEKVAELEKPMIIAGAIFLARVVRVGWFCLGVGVFRVDVPDDILAAVILLEEDQLLVVITYR